MKQNRDRRIKKRKEKKIRYSIILGTKQNKKKKKECERWKLSLEGRKETNEQTTFKNGYHRIVNNKR